MECDFGIVNRITLALVGLNECLLG
jgi:hypothetical protein